ncbi:siderophore-interacting protein [uncultured Salipiger sp.]|uniref:siderophore-interacting protein n=1 Tax=uncultured Salipiger sp. TaxID=499810 RepID=UPI002597825C|nr:siderophore-interacting protein [uncultured Salipiger sp.]
MKHSPSRDFPVTSTARFAGRLPTDLLDHVETHVREFTDRVTRRETGIAVRYDASDVVLSTGAGGLSVVVSAASDLHLYQIRESVAYLLDHVFPEAGAALVWEGGTPETDVPPNFHLATVRSVARVGASFLRVEMACDGIEALSVGGMHFSLILPPEGRAPVWPHIDARGRTAWPEGEDALHRAAYTFVELDAEAGRFTFDVYEHDGGRTTEWARHATPGTQVAVMGPGGGDFPAGDVLLMAGDETALPAIRRILARSAPTRRGKVLIELADAGNREDMPRPEGVEINWITRGRGESLADLLLAEPKPEGDTFVWVAAEQGLVRTARAHFRKHWDLPRDRGYFSAYWSA